MKYTLKLIRFCLLFFLMGLLTLGSSLKAQNERLISSQSKSFENPSVPGTLTIELSLGNIEIRAYEGRVVKLEAYEYQGDEEPNPNLQRKMSAEEDFEFREEYNRMFLSAFHPMNFRVFVPAKTSIKINVLQAGRVDAYETQRLVEVVNQNGSVYLHDLKGWAIINTVNGDIQASFEEVIVNKTMSFIALNGKVELALPRKTKAQFRIKSNTGAIENDFAPIAIELTKDSLSTSNDDLELNSPQKEVDVSSQGSTQKLKDLSNQAYRAPKNYQSISNGGGPIYFISSRNGKILIKKYRRNQDK